MCKKGFARQTRKIVPGAVDPFYLKQENRTIRLLSSETMDQTRPGVPSGTVADIMYTFIVGGDAAF